MYDKVEKLWEELIAEYKEMNENTEEAQQLLLVIQELGNLMGKIMNKFS